MKWFFSSIVISLLVCANNRFVKKPDQFRKRIVDKHENGLYTKNGESYIIISDSIYYGCYSRQALGFRRFNLFRKKCDYSMVDSILKKETYLTEFQIDSVFKWLAGRPHF